MIILHTDSFEHYTTPTDKWDAFLQGPNSAGGIAAGVGRGGGAGFHVTSNASGGVCGLQKNIANTTSVIAGFALQVNVYPTVTGGDICLMAFINGGGSLVELRLDSTGILHFTHNAVNIGFATSNPISFGGAYHYIEIKPVIDASAGSVELRVDQTVVLSNTGLNTGTGGMTGVILGPGSVQPDTFEGGDINIDDFYLIDAAGGDYQGDVQLMALYTREVGAFSNFTRGGTDTGSNFGQVQEHVPDGDTTYITSSTVGDRDSYLFDTVNLTGTVKGMAIWAFAKKTESGARSISLKARHNSVDSPDSALALTTADKYVGQFLPLNPSTSAPWTISEINQMQAGPKVVV